MGGFSDQNSQPIAYTDLISYGELRSIRFKIFTARRMTSILAAARSGEGTVLANVRTVPAVASEKSIELLLDAKKQVSSAGSEPHARKFARNLR